MYDSALSADLAGFQAIGTWVCAIVSFGIAGLGLFTILHPRFRYDPDADPASTCTWTISELGAAHQLRPEQSFRFEEVLNIWWLPASPVEQVHWEEYGELTLLVELTPGARFVTVFPGLDLLLTFPGTAGAQYPQLPGQAALRAEFGWWRLTIQPFKPSLKRIRIPVWCADDASMLPLPTP